MKIAIDAMGGDLGPVATIHAALEVLNESEQLELILVGQADGLNAALPDCPSRLSIHHAEHVVRMDALPAYALRYGKGTSMWEAVSLVRTGVADACVSSGNTGALMAMSRHLLGMVTGVRRPAVCAALPTHHRPTYMLDLGANIQSNPQQLLQFAHMGAALVRQLHAHAYPSIAILNIGKEPSKGTPMLKNAAALFKSAGLHYQGFIEPTNLHDGDVDIVVTDGFTGNIALKAIEGSACFVMDTLVRNLAIETFSEDVREIINKMLGASLMRIDPRLHNGASLLGVNGVVVKSHGNADAFAFAQALLLAQSNIEKNTVKGLASAMSKFDTTPSERPRYPS